MNSGKKLNYSFKHYLTNLIDFNLDEITMNSKQ